MFILNLIGRLIYGPEFDDPMRRANRNVSVDHADDVKKVLSLKLVKKTRSIFKRCIEINTQ